MSDQYIHGRGAQINPDNPFDKHNYSHNGLHWDDDEGLQAQKRNQYIKVYPKTILNKVDSPDLRMGYSMNPYQGCEHGCVYCYARNTHTYWGYSAGIEFEQKILVKESAPELLERKLKSKKWSATPIMLSGNTDCYQPAEKKYQLTRKMLEVLWRYRHPVGVITKNALINRDIDILSKMAEHSLVHVAISITTLDEDIRRRLEPRTSSGEKRLKIVERLSEAGIPVMVMFAPIIPSINDREVFDIARSSAEAGALKMSNTIVRLNGAIGEIFEDWLLKNYPDRYDRVIHQIQSCHGGKLNDSRYGTRMRGEGNYAEMISQQLKIAKEKYFSGKVMPPYDLSLYPKYRDGQLSLFD